MIEVQTPPASPRPLLLALPSCGFPGEALERARELAAARGVPLHVLRAVPRHEATLPPCSLLQSLAALPAVELVVTLGDATRAWLERAGASVASLEVRSGDFEALVVEHGLRLQPGLVIVPGQGPRVGWVAAAIARSLRTPVLVARRHRHSDLIVAASDLSDGDFPVLRAAAGLAADLAAPVVAMHNVAPPPRLDTPDPLLPVALEVSATVAAQRARELQSAVDDLAVPARVVVSRAPRSAEGIVHEARARNADLVVVGTRRHSLLDRLLGREVAEHVVQRALRSVLVLPLPSAPRPP